MLKLRGPSRGSAPSHDPETYSSIRRRVLSHRPFTTAERLGGLIGGFWPSFITMKAVINSLLISPMLNLVQKSLLPAIEAGSGGNQDES